MIRGSFGTCKGKQLRSLLLSCQKSAPDDARKARSFSAVVAFPFSFALTLNALLTQSVKHSECVWPSSFSQWLRPALAPHDGLKSLITANLGRDLKRHACINPHTHTHAHAHGHSQTGTCKASSWSQPQVETLQLLVVMANRSGMARGGSTNGDRASGR